MVDFVTDSYQSNLIDVITDSYQPNSINMSEHQTRSLSFKIHIKSSKSRVPHTFANFIPNGKKKERMVQILIFSYFDI